MIDAPRDYARLAWPVVSAGLLSLPLFFGRGFYLNILDFVGLYSMIAVGLCLLVGYGGQLSISHGAFFAIGAYGSAILSLRVGLPPVLAALATQFMVALVAWTIGAIVLRLRGHYLAIATLSFSIVVAVLIKELSWLTGGLQGLSGVPPIAVGGFAFDTDLRFYYLIWPIALLVLLFTLNLVDSPLGRVFRSIKEDENAARVFGVSASAIKIRLFVLSSVAASLSGSLFAHWIGFVSPAAASILFAIDIILVLALGGFTLLWGAMVGTAAITLLDEYLTTFAEYKRTIFGAALVALIIFFPRGLLPGFLEFAGRVLRRGSAKGA